ncbi:MAG TPA: DMT family transporter [Actinomycetota bacterium]|nr:DMT family transporter [Actinomycetota bacterium]
MRTPAWAVPLVMVAVIAVWGAAFSGIKFLLQDLSAGALTAGRLLIAAVTYLLMLPFVRGPAPDRRKGDLLKLVSVGVFGSAAYHLAINWGEQYVSAGVASLLVATMPVMVAVAAAVLLRESFGVRRAAGVAVAFAGVGLLVAASGQGLQARSVRGVLVTMIAPVAWALYTLVSKPLAARYDGVRLNLTGAWVGALVLAPFAVREASSFASLDAAAWSWLIYLGVLSTAVSYVAWSWCLRRWPASRLATFVYLVPVSSLLWAWALLGERPTAGSLAGGAMILGGVVLVQQGG